MAITAEEVAAQLRALEVEAEAAAARKGRKRKSAPVPVAGTWQHALAERTDATAAVRAHEVAAARGVVAAAGTLAPIITTAPGSGPHPPVPPPPADIVQVPRTSVPPPPADIVQVPRTSVAPGDAPMAPSFQVPSAGEQQVAAGYEVIDPAELEARIAVQDEHIVTLTMALDAQQGDATFQRAQLEDALAARAQAYAALEKISRAHAVELDRTRRAAEERIAALTSAMESAARAAEERIATLTTQLGDLPAAENVAALT